MNKLTYLLYIVSIVVVPVSLVVGYHKLNYSFTMAYGCGYLAAMRLARPDVDKAERNYCVAYRTTAAKYGFNP